jgi:predicted RNA-binding protein
MMNYWLDLFTGTTWDEFRKAGANVTGFRYRIRKTAGRIEPGDVFLCYLTGVKRWVGLLEVTGEMYQDSTQIWKEEVFPIRLPVKPIVMLDAVLGVPMNELKGKLSFGNSPSWTGWLRWSPRKYEREDGEVISSAIRVAEASPVSRPVDPKQLKRSSNLYKFHKKVGGKDVETIVTVPTTEPDEDIDGLVGPAGASHTEIQWRLLDLGSQMGLNVWAPKSDRNKTWNGKPISEIAKLLDGLPTQFDAVTTGTIENIDVLWLSGNAIVAAFEVEHTTSIYSGLLRMSDLLTMQPNIEIKLYLTAPNERYSKFKKEVPRPTFASRPKPLHKVCRFLPYSELCQRLEKAKDFLCHLKPDFIDDIAVLYDPAEEYDEGD